MRQRETPVMTPLPQDDSLYADWAEDESVSRTVQHEYKKYIAQKILFIGVCIVFAIMMVGIGVTIGAYNIGFLEVYQTIINHIMGTVTDSTKDLVVWASAFPVSWRPS